MNNTIFEITQEKCWALTETIYNLDSVAQMLELDKLSKDGDDEDAIVTKLRQDPRGHTISNMARTIRVLSGNLLDMLDEVSIGKRVSGTNAAPNETSVISTMAQETRSENERAEVDLDDVLYQLRYNIRHVWREFNDMIEETSTDETNRHNIVRIEIEENGEKKTPVGKLVGGYFVESEDAYALRNLLDGIYQEASEALGYTD